MAVSLSSCFLRPAPKLIVPPPPTATAKKYRIDQPEVRQRITEYPTVTFTPGEVIQVTAGGCVQTGGHGKTWKDYVNPEGPEASRLYHGQFWIPEVTPGLVRIGWLVGKRLRIPATADPSQLYLRLGYEDDYYPDNGYYKHDNGTDGQCKTQGNAWVEIQRGVTGDPDPLSQAPLDLTLNLRDGLAWTPAWVYDSTHPSPPDAQDPALCNHFPGDNGEISVNRQTCSTQQPAVDYPSLSRFHTIVCHLNDVLHPELTGHLHGHANWFPGSYVGDAVYTGIPADRDVNFMMTVAGPSATTAYPKGGGIELEFASDETIYHFGTPWWRKFASVARNQTEARKMLGSRVVVSGLIGIDNEHEAHAEVHPVYAFAIQAANSSPAAEDVWAIFVRNWGDEGFCSQDRHYLDLARNRFVLEIPWPDGATGVNINYAEPGNPSSIIQSFRTNSAKAAVAVPVILAERRVVQLTYELPPPQEGGRIAGELHFQWTNAAPMARVAIAGPEEREDSAESALEKRLGPRAAALATAPPAKPGIDQLVPHLLSDTRLANLMPPPPESGAPKRRPKTARPRPDQPLADPAKADRDKALAKAICGAVDSKNPDSKDLADACKQLQFKKPGKH